MSKVGDPGWALSILLLRSSEAAEVSFDGTVDLAPCLSRRLFLSHSRTRGWAEAGSRTAFYPQDQAEHPARGSCLITVG